MKVVVVTPNNPKSVDQLNADLADEWYLDYHLVLPNSDVHYVLRKYPFSDDILNECVKSKEAQQEARGEGDTFSYLNEEPELAPIDQPDLS